MPYAVFAGLSCRNICCFFACIISILQINNLLSVALYLQSTQGCNKCQWAGLCYAMGWVPFKFELISVPSMYPTVPFTVLNSELWTVVGIRWLKRRLSFILFAQQKCFVWLSLTQCRITIQPQQNVLSTYVIKSVPNPISSPDTFWLMDVLCGWLR